MTEKQDIAIDYCPQCRGIWLEKGKLERFLESPTSQFREERTYDRRERFDDDDDDDHHGRYNDDDLNRAYGPNRKKSFFKDLFDF